MKMDKAMDFKGKVALVTGAGSGIGAAIAILLHKLGATLSITDINGEGLKRTLDECLKISSENPKPLLSIGDISDEKFQKAYIENSIKSFNQMDILVNNAGIAPSDSVENSSLATFDRVIGINLRAPYNLIALAHPHLKKTKGCIVNMASCISKTAAVPNLLSYVLSKVGLNKLTKMAASELGKDGIRVNSVNPGAILTPIHKQFAPDVSEDDMVALFSARTALGHIGVTDDVAKAVAFLASENARIITGINMLVDAGVCVKYQ